MADNLDSISGDLVESKKAILAQRRCIILAVVGATLSSNITLANVLQIGFLSTVKSWLDDILGGSVGELVVSFLRLAVVNLSQYLYSRNFLLLRPYTQEA